TFLPVLRRSRFVPALEAGRSPRALLALGCSHASGRRIFQIHQDCCVLFPRRTACPLAHAQRVSVLPETSRTRGMAGETGRTRLVCASIPAKLSAAKQASPSVRIGTSDQ